MFDGSKLHLRRWDRYSANYSEVADGAQALVNLKTINEADKKTLGGHTVISRQSRAIEEPLTGNFAVSKALPPLPPSKHLDAISKTPASQSTHNLAFCRRSDNHTGIESMHHYQRHTREITTSKSQHLFATRESYKSNFKKLNLNLGQKGSLKVASTAKSHFNYLAFCADLKST